MGNTINDSQRRYEKTHTTQQYIPQPGRQRNLGERFSAEQQHESGNANHTKPGNQGFLPGSQMLEITGDDIGDGEGQSGTCGVQIRPVQRRHADLRLPDHQDGSHHPQGQGQQRCRAQPFVQKEMPEQHRPQGRNIEKNQRSGDRTIQHGEHKSHVGPAGGNGHQRQFAPLPLHPGNTGPAQHRQHRKGTAIGNQHLPGAVQPGILQQA